MSNNRFSILLESLMEAANLKNITLAQELQYDVSYISKWVNGRMLPSEKGLDKILRGISRCITCSLQKENQELLYHKYNVSCEQDLEDVIYDNLLIEYNYVKDLKVDTGSEIAPQIAYFPELTLLQFVSKMRHPVLRNVQSLEVVAMLDLLAMDKNCQLVVAELQHSDNSSIRMYPGVHFSMLIDTSLEHGNVLRNTELLLNMINNFSTVNFNLYESKQAIGKAIFTVEGSFTISGMITDSNHCIAVTTSENAEISNVMYHKLKSFCTHSNKLLEHTNMIDFLLDNSYMKSILSERHQWLISSVTEHFLPDDLFEEMMDNIPEEEKNADVIAMVYKIHALTRNILEETRTKVILYDSALQNLMVTGELDFFNYKIYLNTEQRIRYLKSLVDLMDRNKEMEIRILSKETLPNFQLISTPNVFGADSFTHIRMNNRSEPNNIKMLTKSSIRRILYDAFGEIWSKLGEEAAEEAHKLITQISRSLHFLSKTEQCDDAG